MTNLFGREREASRLDEALSLARAGSGGLRAEADAVLSAMVALHQAIDYPQSRWRLPMLRAGFCLFDGGHDEAGRPQTIQPRL